MITASALRALRAEPDYATNPDHAEGESIKALLQQRRAERNPFFLTGTSTPVREVRVVSKEERTRAYAIFEA